MKNALRIITFLGVFFMLCCAYLFFRYPILNHTAVFEIHTGETVPVITQRLEKSFELKIPFLFKASLFLTGIDKHIQSGEYQLTSKVSLYQLLMMMNQGKVKQYAFTVIPGWDYQTLLEKLNQAPKMNHRLKRTSLLSLKKIFKTQSLEGIFYPNTYYYVKGESDIVLLKKAHQLMQKTLGMLWAYRAKGVPFHHAWQALTAASLVEKEAKLDRERQIIASVLINRLKINMPLQFCSSVIYAGGIYDGKITQKELAIHSPFNTYVHYGLPPGPIAYPSLASLKAVLHPAKTAFLYFYATKSGAHVFSVTLKAHNQAIAIYGSSL